MWALKKNQFTPQNHFFNDGKVQKNWSYRNLEAPLTIPEFVSPKNSARFHLNLPNFAENSIMPKQAARRAVIFENCKQSQEELNFRIVSSPESRNLSRNIAIQNFKNARSTSPSNTTKGKAFSILFTKPFSSEKELLSAKYLQGKRY